MADDKKPETKPAEDTSKAEQERLDYFHANHRPPAGYQSRVVKNRIVIEPIPKRKKG